MLTQLHVVTALFNPWRYKTRGEHYRRFRKHVRDTNMCTLYAGELAFGAREFEYTQGHDIAVDEGHTWEYQFRTRHELWHKERMLNRLIQELPSNWEYVAWVDADLQFARDDWAKETVEMLQHFPIVQMFSHAQNLDTYYRVHDQQPPRLGFAYAWANGLQPAQNPYYPSFPYGHPGFAWAMRRDAFDQMGGLLDIAALGAGDYYMALACIEEMEQRLSPKFSAGYCESLRLWANRSRRYIKKNLGHVEGLVNHYFHGNRRDRKYADRNQILEQFQYDPEFDLKADAQGLWQWSDRSPEMQYAIRQYFMTRREDHPSD